MVKHPGHVVVVGNEGDLYIINVLSMMTLKHFVFDFTGCFDC